MEDEPVLHRHLEWIWKAFTDLNYRRGVGFSGPVPITYSDIEAYCRLKGIFSLLERERLVRFIDFLDRHWMAAHYEKQAEGEGEGPKNRNKEKPKDVPPIKRRPPRSRVT